MKLLKLYKKLGNQTIKRLKNTPAVVYIEGKEYYITGIKYRSGIPLGFNAEEIGCKNCKNNLPYPPPHTCDECTSLTNNEDFTMWEQK